MKIFQLPYCFYPDAVGGTEIYVAALARELLILGHESVIVTPGRVNETYTHEQVKVIRLQTSPELSLEQLYGDGDACIAEQFEKALVREKPDIVHLHAFTAGVSIRLARIVKSKRIPLVLTYHTPTVTCPRGTMMRWGSAPCDGRMDLSQCVSCTLHGKGMSRESAEILSVVSRVLGSSVRAAHLEGVTWTALRMQELLSRRFSVTHELFDLCDHIIAAANWVKEVLLRNNVLEEKVTVLKQGLCSQGGEASDLIAAVPMENTDGKVKAIFLGRLHPTKGIEVVISALKMDADLPVTLDIYGVRQGADDTAYFEQLKKDVGGDVRIRFLPAITAEAVVATIRRYDVLLVPSQWMETGPMVVLEAFAAGIPVIGADLGGIRDLVEHNVNGLLVPFDSLKRWQSVLTRVASEPSLLCELKTKVKAPKTMQTVAQAMNEIYRGIFLEPA